MPVIEFECEMCGEREEFTIPIDKEYIKITSCPHCYGAMLLVPSLPASMRVGKYGKGGG